MSIPILEVKNLSKFYKTPSGMLHAVEDVSFTIDPGKTLGVVGESGCGKTTTGRAILRLVEPTSGQVIFDGTDITALSPEEMRQKRRVLQLIFQDPFSSLDPRKTIHDIIAEPIVYNKLVKDKEEVEKRVLELVDIVGLSRRFVDSYPHELDGGRRQRVGIARVLGLNPKFIVCDEPVSALDVSIQAQILNLLEDLQESLGLTYLFITHDLAVVNHFADDIAVMYLGQLVEKTSAEELFSNPLHPYTKALLSAIPVPEVGQNMQRTILRGEISSPIDPKNECRFAKRCLYANEECHSKTPKLVEVEPEHFVACPRCMELK